MALPKRVPEVPVSPGIKIHDLRYYKSSRALRPAGPLPHLHPRSCSPGLRPAHRLPATPPRGQSLPCALLTSARLIADVTAGACLARPCRAVGRAAQTRRRNARRHPWLQALHGCLRDYGRQDFILGRLLQKPLPEPCSPCSGGAPPAACRSDTAHTVVDQVRGALPPSFPASSRAWSMVSCTQCPQASAADLG